MNPHTVANRLKETLCTYLETAYRISHPTVIEERARLLRQGEVVSQTPFVETTPLFRRGERLHDLELPWIPEALSELAQFGLPTNRFPLWKHQEQALRAAWDEEGNPRNLIVATGTGSGKTECFYLPILSDILREALNWPAPTREAAAGEWNGQLRTWLHQRRHEARPAAIRAIVLYPMNALVNDQLRRLRRILALDDALRWQDENLHGNRIYFGRYTSQTELPGSPEVAHRRERWREYQGRIQAGWDTVGATIRNSGGWPRTDGSEMLCRWDMQAAPPDIIITNYSMLEYMLVRPIEAPIFDQTRDWLANSEDHILTLVLDEAHTYTGARGTEVSYLIRRLFERLGASPDQVRCIATSASLGKTEEDLRKVTRFASDLFSHSEDRFTVIQAEEEQVPNNLDAPSDKELQAFADFQKALEETTRRDQSSDEDRILRASNKLLSDLGLEIDGSDASQILYNALETFPRLLDIRQRTARNAQSLDNIADLLWNNIGDKNQRHSATAGLLSAGAYARPKGSADLDAPPLLPSRLHLMFRGLPGIWACVDPNCSQVAETDQGQRPCGRLYVEPRIWCECGARVLEVFSCRICGLLFLGGVPDDDGRLWPYERSLEGGFQDYDSYQVFAVENPGAPATGRQGWAEERRSLHTTAIETRPEVRDTRTVWVNSQGGGENERGRPYECPRCNARRSPRREIIEPLRSTGPQSFTVVMEDSFRIQAPRGPQEQSEQVQAEPRPRWFQPRDEEKEAAVPPTGNPNRGRKALVFSDGRQDAAMLAGSLTYLHARDLFRQLLLVALNESQDREVPVEELRDRIFNLSVSRGIDPTLGEVENFWSHWEANQHAAQQLSGDIIDTYLRREIADREVGVEALGLAQWVLDSRIFNLDYLPALSPFGQSETPALLYAVLRILAGENLLLPADRNPENWPLELVEPYYRRIIVRPPSQTQNALVWEASRNNRLTRYLSAVAHSVELEQDGLANLMENLWEDYLRDRILTTTSGTSRPGWGLPITRLALAPLPEKVLICTSCGYLSAETVRGICIRCHGRCEEIYSSEISERQRNYYHHLALQATSDEEYPDPFPMRALEHTAQISATDSANRERHFQDQFIPSGGEQENPHECRVDILSVTTTMEMGIDIGDLTVVGLHNTPPTVANYQQRAGRAGRRSDGVATVLTYARDRSHDQYYYSRVAEIVTGDVRVPEVHLDNPVIAQRHIHALILQRFFLNRVQLDEANNLLAAFGSVSSFRGGEPSGLEQLRGLLTEGEFRNAIEDSASRIVPNRTGELTQWLNDLPGQIEQTLESVRGEEDLLEVLIKQGVLPRYAFPVDLVALWIEEPTRYNRGEEVQRDLQIALSEYAPDGEVVIDGWVYTSTGLYTPFVENPSYEADSWFYECPDCRYIQIAEQTDVRPDWTACPICMRQVEGSHRRRPAPAIRPRGFRTDWTEGPGKHRGESRERVGFATTVQLHAGDTARSEGEQLRSGRLWIHHRVGDLYVVNRGDSELYQEPGFWICSRCGRSLESGGENHNVPEHVAGSHSRRCPGQAAQKAILLHGFRSDVALVAVELPATLAANPIYPRGRAVWLSFGNALLRAAATNLQIDTNELAVGMRPWRHPDGRLMGEVFLYDTLPNGAGYADEFVRNIEQILEVAHDICANCRNTDCETACYRCLLDYGNQRNHALLNRDIAIDLLDFIREGREPEISVERQERALDHLEHFALLGYNLAPAIVHNFGRRRQISRVLTTPEGSRISLWPIHTLRIPPEEYTTAARDMGTIPVYISEFDLNVRPFWVWNQILRGDVGMLE